jgi:FAD synthetase
MIKVITFGTFDLFHPGHISYLKQAKKLGDHLTVIIARDQTVKEVKGFHPHDSEEIRLKNVENSQLANTVILGSISDKYQVLLDHKPNIIALGYDQQAFTENLKQFIINNDLTIQIVRLESYFPEKYKSSHLKNKNANT